MAKQPLQVTLPRTLVSAARSRTRPTDSVERGSEVRQEPAYALLNNVTRNYRDATAITSLIRHLARSEGPFSSAVHTMVEVAATKYRIFAYTDADQKFDAEATKTAMAIMAGMDTPTEYLGATQKRSIDETVKIMLREAILTGMVSAELVLNKARQPDRVQLVGAETLIWQDDGKGGVTPAQTISGETDPVSLNIPTFFYSHLAPDPSTVTPRSMMEASIKMLVYFGEFLDEIRRSVRIAGHNRLKVALNADKIAATAPAGTKNDPVKLQNYLETVRSGVESTLAGIEPEQALVLFSSADVDVLQSGMGTRLDYTPLLNVIAGQYATAMKTPPSVLGLRMEGGSQQLGSVETTVFLKSAKALHTPVETVMSRILTLGCRLYGHPVTVWFRMDPLDLRPDNELEAFLTMRESRIWDKLSLGYISDDEAAVELGCFPRPDGAPDLSGTMFRHKGGGDVGKGNEEVDTHPGDSPLGRQLQPDKDAPRKAGGRSQ